MTENYNKIIFATKWDYSAIDRNDLPPMFPSDGYAVVKSEKELEIYNILDFIIQCSNTDYLYVITVSKDEYEIELPIEEKKYVFKIKAVLSSNQKEQCEALVKLIDEKDSIKSFTIQDIVDYLSKEKNLSNNVFKQSILDKLKEISIEVVGGKNRIIEKSVKGETVTNNNKIDNSNHKKYINTININNANPLAIVAILAFAFMACFIFTKPRESSLGDKKLENMEVGPEVLPKLEEPPEKESEKTIQKKWEKEGKRAGQKAGNDAIKTIEAVAEEFGGICGEEDWNKSVTKVEMNTLNVETDEKKVLNNKLESSWISKGKKQSKTELDNYWNNNKLQQCMEDEFNQNWDNELKFSKQIDLNQYEKLCRTSWENSWKDAWKDVNEKCWEKKWKKSWKDMWDKTRKLDDELKIMWENEGDKDGKSCGEEWGKNTGKSACIENGKNDVVKNDSSEVTKGIKIGEIDVKEVVEKIVEKIKDEVKKMAEQMAKQAADENADGYKEIMVDVAWQNIGENYLNNNRVKILENIKLLRNNELDKGWKDDGKNAMDVAWKNDGERNRNKALNEAVKNAWENRGKGTLDSDDGNFDFITTTTEEAWKQIGSENWKKAWNDKDAGSNAFQSKRYEAYMKIWEKSWREAFSKALPEAWKTGWSEEEWGNSWKVAWKEKRQSDWDNLWKYEWKKTWKGACEELLDKEIKNTWQNEFKKSWKNKWSTAWEEIRKEKRKYKIRLYVDNENSYENLYKYCEDMQKKGRIVHLKKVTEYNFDCCLEFVETIRSKNESKNDMDAYIKNINKWKNEINATGMNIKWKDEQIKQYIIGAKVDELFITD